MAKKTRTEPTGKPRPTRKHVVQPYLAIKLRELRLAHDWSFHRLEAESGVTDETLIVIEQYGRTPLFSTMVQIARAFNVSLDEFVPPDKRYQTPTKKKK